MPKYSALIVFALWCVMLFAATVVADGDDKPKGTVDADGKFRPYAPPQPSSQSTRNNYPYEIPDTSTNTNPNLVVNGDFEASASTWTGWDEYGGAVYIANDVDQNGNPYHFIALGTVGGLGYIHQSLPTVPGNYYTLEFLLLSTSLYSYLNLNFGSQWVNYTTFTTPNNNWEWVSITTLATATTTDLWFYERNDPTYFYVDKVSVRVTGFGATQYQTNYCPSTQALGSATVVPVGGTAPFTYSWSPSGGNQATATGLAPGQTYTVTVTDATGLSLQRYYSIIADASCTPPPPPPAVPVIMPTIPALTAATCTGPFAFTGLTSGTQYTLGSLDLDMNTCTFFSAAGCAAGADLSTSFTAAGTSQQFYLMCDETWYQTISANSFSSNVFQVVKYETGGDICGDPHFIGYDGREFLFNGEIGKYYNIFSNPYVTVNSLFGDAKGANPYVTYTINSAMGVRTFDFNISLDPHMYDEKTSTIVFQFNGKNITIGSDEKQYLHNGCVEISFEKTHKTRHHHHTFAVNTHKFKLNAYVSKDSDLYINTVYLDYYIAHDSTDANLLGGIIGDTARDYDPDEIVDHPERYEVEEKFAASAKYGEQSVCKITQQTKPIISKNKRQTCQTLPNGYHCYKHGSCSSGWCGAYGVCQPWGGCFDDRMCGTGSGHTCNQGTRMCSN